MFKLHTYIYICPDMISLIADHQATLIEEKGVKMTSVATNTAFYIGSDPSFGIFRWQAAPSIKWMSVNWHISVYISIIYVLVIFTLHHKMKTRTPFKLRQCLVVWNAA